MKKMSIVVLVMSLLLFVGCSSVQIPPAGAQEGPIAGVLSRDLDTTAALAKKYGAPEIAQCATYLHDAVAGSSALLAEKTDGLISLSVKLYLLKQQGIKGEDSFKQQCGTFAAGLLLELGKNARPGFGLR